jgi:hypothetical protein
MLINKIYLLDKWLSSNNREFIMIGLVALSVTLLTDERTLFYGIGLIGIISLWVVLVKSNIMNGKLKFDKTGYTLPKIGENIIIKKDFRYNINKVLNSRNYINSEFYVNFRKDWKFKVIDINETKDDWIIILERKFPLSIKNIKHTEVFYLDFKPNMKTLTDIRDEKLKKILK